MAEKQYRVASREWRGKIPCPGWLWLLFLVTSHAPLAAALDDPTEPPPNYQATPVGGAQANVESATPVARWLLTSTLISPQRRIAIINGRALKPGDTLENVTVVEITPATVRLRDTQGEFSVTMQPAAVKIPSGRPETPQP